MTHVGGGGGGGAALENVKIFFLINLFKIYLQKRVISVMNDERISVQE